MTGRQKIEAAFSPDGSPEFAAVICYEGIFIRDHWSQLSSYPWWYAAKPDVESQMRWRREVIKKIGQDWFALPACHSRDERQHIFIEERGDEVLCINRRTGKSEKLEKPRVSGWSATEGVQSYHPLNPPETPEEIDARLPFPPPFDADAFVASGRADLAKEMLKEFGETLFPMGFGASVLWNCYSLWGYEGMMIRIAT